MPNPKDRKALEDAIAGGLSIDDLIGEAKRTVAKPAVVDTANAIAAGGRGGSTKLEQKLNEESRVAPVLKRTATMAAIPASFLSGPVGMAAMALLGGEGVMHAAENPTAGNVGLAGLGLLPALGPMFRALSRGGRLAADAGEAGQVLHGADAFADAASRVERVPPKKVVNPFHPETRPTVTAQPPSSAPGRTPYAGDVTPFNPAEAHLPNTPAASHYANPADAAEQITPSVSRHMPNIPAASHTPNPDHGAMAGLESLIERFMPNTPSDEVAQRFAQAEGTGASLDAGAEIPLSEVMQSPAQQRFGIPNKGPMPSDTRLDEMVSKFGGRGAVEPSASPLLRGEHTAYPPKLGGRVDDLHEAQTTGGQFGFEDLPEISESELSRIQDLFNRLRR